MSISATLANALTGLTAASRAAQLVGSNVSNAMTDGYARRELNLSAQVVGRSGAGVQIDGITRVVDETVLRDRRLAEASLNEVSERAGFWSALLSEVGLPEDPGSLVASFAEFDAALIEATSRPESEARLSNVLDTAQRIVGALNRGSNAIQTLRQDADASIEASVSRINSLLQQVDDLNGMILRSKSTGDSSPGLYDQRQAVVDEISGYVPLRQVSRSNGTVALYSTNGATLVDNTPAVLGFQATGTIIADMTLASGALSGLTLNGEPVSTDGESGQMYGGRLSALFAVRDEVSIVEQGRLDALAADLIERFEDPALDPTLGVGDPGLFTDGGNPLDPADLVGLSGRVSVNSLVDPTEGGALWRLRDGLGATTQGPPGDSTLLSALRDRLSEARVPTSGILGSGEVGISTHANGVLSAISQSSLRLDQDLSFVRSNHNALRDIELADGVNTDQEMQKLLLIEQAYAANARVVQTADRLIQTLLEL